MSPRRRALLIAGALVALLALAFVSPAGDLLMSKVATKNMPPTITATGAPLDWGYALGVEVTAAVDDPDRDAVWTTFYDAEGRIVGDWAAQDGSRLDYNGNGYLDAGDEDRLKKYAKSGRGCSAEFACDFTGDGRVDDRDLDLFRMIGMRRSAMVPVSQDGPVTLRVAASDAVYYRGRILARPRSVSVDVTVDVPEPEYGYACYGLAPQDAYPCDSEETGLDAPAKRVLAEVCGRVNRCEYVCRTGYVREGGECVREKRPPVQKLEASLVNDDTGEYVACTPDMEPFTLSSNGFGMYALSVCSPGRDASCRPDRTSANFVSIRLRPEGAGETAGWWYEMMRNGWAGGLLDFSYLGLEKGIYELRADALLSGSWEQGDTLIASATCRVNIPLDRPLPTYIPLPPSVIPVPPTPATKD